jgi:hypothetical protein
LYKWEHVRARERERSLAGAANNSLPADRSTEKGFTSQARAPKDNRKKRCSPASRYDAEGDDKLHSKLWAEQPVLKLEKMDGVATAASGSKWARFI